ncbi:hypothetical protein [Xylanibacter muris]|uniref:Uncharacterized protein n=1 Tax=Xylanibacter muris TaxID=2736290 RepID=A0ABX2AP30_9BACT|nr:hypothetical protein [Xylanibacter muris]NPD93001.1 hypothetical protein [Xylanibacter muris]
MIILHIVLLVGAFAAMVLRSRVLKLKATFFDTFLSVLFFIMILNLTDRLIPGHMVLSFFIGAVIYAPVILWLSRDVPKE